MIQAETVRPTGMDYVWCGEQGHLADCREMYGKPLSENLFDHTYHECHLPLRCDGIAGERHHRYSAFGK